MAYPEGEDIQLDTSDPDGALLYWEMALFRRLQAVGSPMAIDMKAYLRVIEAGRETPGEVHVDSPTTP